MSKGAMQGVVRELRRAALIQDPAEQSDAQLVESFLRREIGAFDALLRRHGKMVLGVCRRVLGNAHDAEDAFQATFLVFVQKAATVRHRDLLGSWLYGVAYRTALDAKTAAARRRAKEDAMRTVATNQAADDDIWRELQPLLDRELSRLPDKYRVPIVLCDLEGKTQKEAARMLGCPQGTVSGRLARGRILLATHMKRHGLTVSGGALAWALAQDAARAAVPPALADGTSRMAAAVLAGQPITTAASAKVAGLTKGALKAMLMTKLKVVAGCLVLLVLGSLLAYQPLADVFAGDGGGSGQVPLAVPGASEKKDVASPTKGGIVLMANLRLKYEGNDEEEEYAGIISVDPETGKWKKIVGLASGPGSGSGGCHRVSPDGETLAFVRNDATVGVWTCDMQRADKPAKISDRGEWGSRLLWSPKGERLVVSNAKFDKLEKKWTNESWLMDADGSHAMKLPIPDTDGLADWSRDGKWFAIDRHVTGLGSSGIYLLRPDGKDQQQLTKGGASNSPRFSPDSRKIAYLHYDKEGSSIWTMDVDGQNKHKVLAQEDLVSPMSVCWSPDGKRLAVLLFKYHRNEEGTPILSDPAKADFHLEIIDADGGNRRRLDIAGPKVNWIENVDWR
jgi:RNA polymerase sigma factor (sigma-70 family)